MNKVALLGVRSCVIFCPSVISDCASAPGSVLREEAVSNYTRSIWLGPW